MNKWIILVTGSVVFGACSMKRHTERTQSASAQMSMLEERSGLRGGTMEAALNRSLQIERRWVVELPEVSGRIRYEEHIRLGVSGQVATGSVHREEVSSSRQVDRERRDYDVSEKAGEVQGIRWSWWLLGIMVGAGAWVAWRFIRVWPFK
ncbi:hypothetical protein [Parapedobacter sp. 2B3]|uniref:hypothetical protein n=1 Tax=Parapedobacter sp. 2B3 TaxID=3342381 RepID=UPI0035B5C862